MAKYLLDVNMPNYFGEWQPPVFQHMVEIGRTWSDTKIWEYAQRNSLTILTKDYDFYDRIVVEDPPPWVVHFRLGNMKLKDFQSFIADNWIEISELSTQNKLVVVFEDEILSVG
ncbi:MAG: DUF5615 family PIN-like protein [Saprospiraceae bacterium]